MLVYQPFARPANQDRKHFALGDSDAKPASGYFASVTGLADEEPIKEAVATLTDLWEIEDKLFEILGSSQQAQDYMRWRMGLRPKPRPTPKPRTFRLSLFVRSGRRP